MSNFYNTVRRKRSQILSVSRSSTYYGEGAPSFCGPAMRKALVEKLSLSVANHSAKATSKLVSKSATMVFMKVSNFPSLQLLSNMTTVILSSSWPHVIGCGRYQKEHGASEFLYTYGFKLGPRPRYSMNSRVLNDLDQPQECRVTASRSYWSIHGVSGILMAPTS